MTQEDWLAIRLTLTLAVWVTVLLLLIGFPLAWWLVHGRSRLRPLVVALVALPLVLPPTVLGFYLLIAFSPGGVLGQWLVASGLPSVLFRFEGLVIASLIYSLPFVVQPLYQAIRQLGLAPLEVANSLGASRGFIWRRLLLPLLAPGITTAAVLGFLHTVGEFGVVLMIGGNIPGETRVLSIHLYQQVETLQYAAAHRVSLVLVAVALLGLWLLYGVQLAPRRRRVGL
jgi:molybdate transport system permease protein